MTKPHGGKRVVHPELCEEWTIDEVWRRTRERGGTFIYRFDAIQGLKALLKKRPKRGRG